ncbi:MAG TPA: hypothetical protein VIJ46_05975 [Rhabdochlamydiaceae bacterium]
MIDLNPTRNRRSGALAGEEVFLPGIDDQPTYGRKYKPCASSDDLRERLGEVNIYTKLDPRFTMEGEAWKAMGEEYSRTTSGYFHTVKEYAGEDQRRYLTCYAYALGTFGAKLEEVAGKSMGEIQQFVKNGDIAPVLRHCFTNVTEPRDGDLVIYSIAPGKLYRDYRGNSHSGPMHAGIYRLIPTETEIYEVFKKWRQRLGIIDPNKKPPQLECIESKWGVWRIPYVFQHEVFFMSPMDGEEVTFYRLNDPSSSFKENLEV